MDAAYSVHLYANGIQTLIFQSKLSMELVDCLLWVKITVVENQ